MDDHGIKQSLTADEARAWASRRWGCCAHTEEHSHPTSIGDSIAIISVHDGLGQGFRGLGYSGMAPIGVSMWAKAAWDLLRQEPLANHGGGLARRDALFATLAARTEHLA